MALDVDLSTAARNAALDALLDLLDVGGAGTIKIYDGSKPAGPGTAISGQTLLVTLTLSATGFAGASGGTATANAITSGTAVASGTPTWARLASGGGTAVIDVTVGTSGTDLVISSATIASGNTVSASSLTFTLPAST